MAIRTLNSSGVIASGPFGITRRAQPLNVELDPAVLGAGAAAALGAAIADGIRNISQTVAPATRIYREKALKAFNRGARWALERYSRPPGTGDQMFNDSGELADSVEVDQAGDAFEISLAADRLQAAGGSDLTDQLEELVPAFGNPFDDDGVSAAIDASLDMITIG